MKSTIIDSLAQRWRGVLKTLLSFLIVVATLATACNPNSSGVTRLSIATGPTGGVYYPYGGGIARVISLYIPEVEATAEVTAASVDNLKLVRDRKSDLALTTGDTLADAINGTGLFQGTKLRLRVIANLYWNYTQVVTLSSSGINDLSGLRGKVVSTGPAGSGSEVTALRVLEAEGIDSSTDIRQQRLGLVQAVDALRDGKLDAFFWSAGLPTGSILDLSHTQGITIRMLPNSHVLDKLKKTYGDSLYTAGIVPKNVYPGLEADIPVVSVANFLVVHEAMAESVVYDITRTLFEHQAELAAIHPEANNLKLQTAATGSPAPFHSGAILCSREQKFWRERE